MTTQISELKPTLVATATGINIFANVQVFLDNVKGWSAVVTVVLGVPTAILILAYWVLKVRKEWRGMGDK